MNSTPFQSEEQQKFQELVSKIRAAMLVSRKPDGSLKARPMMLVEASEQGTLKFITGRDTEKVEDVVSDPHVSVTFQQGGAFLSVSGQAVIEDNRAELHRLWNKGNDAWFDGPDDPRAVLLKVEADQAEYWDNRGIKGLKYVFQAVRAAVQGTEPKVTRDQHGRVRL